MTIIAQWLDAKYYCTEFAPIPIQEYLVFDGAIHSISSASNFFGTASQLSENPARKPQRIILPATSKELGSPLLNAVVALAVETSTAGYGALVFCSSRQSCQFMAGLIAESIPQHARLAADTLDKRCDLLADLRSLPIGLDETLSRTVPHGVAFHRKHRCGRNH